MSFSHAQGDKYKQGESLHSLAGNGCAVDFLKNKALWKVLEVANKVTLIKFVWVIAMKM